MPHRPATSGSAPSTGRSSPRSSHGDQRAQKTLTDAGYIAVGLGVMGFQQAQIRARGRRGPRRARREPASRAGPATCRASSVPRLRRATHAQTARTQAEAQVRHTVARASEMRDELGKRVEPVVGQVQAQLGELPERVVQAMEPVAARVRELAGNAA